MNYLRSILDDYDIIIKKPIMDKVWWFRSNIILLELKNSFMITMAKKLAVKVKYMETRNFISNRQYSRQCYFNYCGCCWPLS